MVEVRSRSIEDCSWLLAVERLWNQTIGERFERREDHATKEMVYTVPEENVKWWIFWLRREKSSRPE
jgi:hypothetical protein